MKAGNSEFKKAAEQTRAALERFDLPELRCFCEEFLPSFELALDEMGLNGISRIYCPASPVGQSFVFVEHY